MISYAAMFFCGFGVAFALLMLLWTAIYFDEKYPTDDELDDMFEYYKNNYGDDDHAK